MSEKVPIVRSKVEDLMDKVKDMGIACEIVKITVEGGATLPGSEPYSSRRAATIIEAIVALDATDKGSASKLNAIHSTLSKVVTDKVKEQLKDLSEVTGG